jgi:beta-galactosidase/beta-glucuronidase
MFLETFKMNRFFFVEMTSYTVTIQGETLGAEEVRTQVISDLESVIGANAKFPNPQGKKAVIGEDRTQVHSLNMYSEGGYFFDVCVGKTTQPPMVERILLDVAKNYDEVEVEY